MAWPWAQFWQPPAVVEWTAPLAGLTAVLPGVVLVDGPPGGAGAVGIADARRLAGQGTLPAAPVALEVLAKAE